MDINSKVPTWLEVLLAEKFFNACLVHENEKRNEENLFCTSCSMALCPHCLVSHQSNHRILKIRRYVYRDVLGLKDVEKLFDCSSVQSYTTNHAKVLFLNPRPMPKQPKGSENLCTVCDRSLQPSFLFCSIFCKVHQMACFRNKRNMEEYNMSKSENSPINRYSAHEKDSTIGSSDGSSNAGTPEAIPYCAISSCSTSMIAKKKRSPIVRESTCSPVVERIVSTSTSINRRKSAPHRSPLY